jgi:hypothetical protein
MTEPTPDKKAASRIKLNYVKSNLFRVIHTDGAVVALSPSQDVTINLFSQRFSIPDEIIIDFDEDDNPIGETTRSELEEDTIGKVVIREIDTLAFMSLDAARMLMFQLQEILEESEDEDEDEDKD